MDNLIRKLSSRKLWVAILASALCVIVACFGEELTPEMVDTIKAAVSVGMVYIFGESAVDVSRLISEAFKKIESAKDTSEEAE